MESDNPTRPQRGERLAYEQRWTENGALFQAFAFQRDGADARILICRNGEVIEENENFPAYKIYNVAAHLPDYARNYEKEERK